MGRGDGQGRSWTVFGAIVLSVAMGLAGCRESGRPSNRSGSNNNTKPPPDAGPQDATFTRPDAGFVDSGSTTRDGGTPPPRDAGMASRDATVRDSGPPVGNVLTVYDLQDPSRPNHPAEDEALALRDVVVTAVVTGDSSEGSFWVQEPAGGPYSGVFVFRPESVPIGGVQVGDRVSLSGTYTEYFDLTEVVLVTLDSVQPGAPLAATTVAPVELATGSPSAEQWEGVFVRVDSVTVLDDMPDAPDDFGEWVVTGGLRIDDVMYRADPRPTPGTTFTSIVGVHHYSFENYKILPRDAADLFN